MSVKYYSQTRPAELRMIDLFAGIGGFRLAFEGLGAECVFASEWDKYSQETYKANFGHQPAGDITELEAAEVPPHDIMTAGFPCQPFSIAGVSKANSLGRAHGFAHATQGTLFFDVCRLIAYHRPRAILLENVRNLVSHDKGNTLRVIQRTLEEELGYHVKMQIVDARGLVPQHRERIYIVGFREESDFEFPFVPDLKPRLRDILEPNVEERYTLSEHLWQYLQNYAAKHKAAGNGFGYGMPDFDGVTRTLSARYHKDGSEILIEQPNSVPRRLTPRECARLMGFPDWFKIPVSDSRAYRQFGNSVVVPVVRLIAQEILQCLHRQKPQESGQFQIMETLSSRPSMPLQSPVSAEDYENGEWDITERFRGAPLATRGTA